ncbi:hypothetical protein P3T23_004555 [Paraburkholderia sp. GAS448]|uniref:hypothetical protein n=1 Tax=Paraburkholderia sp. GAS448 TaxID=3035136 RepID=UPI003D22A579
MKKKEVPPSPSPAELVESCARLAEENSVLESAADAALETGHRHLTQLEGIRAVARAIARRPMSDVERIALAGALEQLCSQARTEASLHVQRLGFARNYRRLSACLALVDDELLDVDCAPTRH